MDVFTESGMRLPCGRSLFFFSKPQYSTGQCKYAAVARGDACIYLRLPTRVGYEEKIWDHATGSLLVAEAGGAVTDTTGRPLDFSLGRTLKDNVGVVASNGTFHTEVIDQVVAVLNGGGDGGDN